MIKGWIQLQGIDKDTFKDNWPICVDVSRIVAFSGYSENHGIVALSEFGRVTVKESYEEITAKMDELRKANNR